MVSGRASESRWVYSSTLVERGHHKKSNHDHRRAEIKD